MCHMIRGLTCHFVMQISLYDEDYFVDDKIGDWEIDLSKLIFKQPVIYKSIKFGREVCVCDY